MMLQKNLFDVCRRNPVRETNLPEGFHYQKAFITPGEQHALVTHIQELPFREFEFLGYTGKRRVVSFGWKYEYSSRRIRKAPEIPDFLLPLRVLAASFANLEPEEFQQALVTEYTPGAGIGWHRDKAVFGQVVGLSLLATCVLRLRRKVGEKWERANMTVEPCSAYLLSGEARSSWEHSIP
ncbi:MAG TPA: alpha-ketoglutarate-dependent dioxygenase AlkB, partial [Blastocatellia bacterium]|nr:alpha-ketoglutarate-dependent dioxygenase AlkB [Blastocatellia bacterium]